MCVWPVRSEGTAGEWLFRLICPDLGIQPYHGKGKKALGASSSLSLRSDACLGAGNTDKGIADFTVRARSRRAAFLGESWSLEAVAYDTVRSIEALPCGLQR